MNPNCLHFLIDCPPSYGRANRRYKFKHVLSDEYRLYKKACAEAVREHRAPENVPLIAFVACFWGKRVGDVDACLKATLDGFTEGGLWDDDRVVVCAPPFQMQDIEHPRVEAWVCAADDYDCAIDLFTDLLIAINTEWSER